MAKEVENPLATGFLCGHTLGLRANLRVDSRA